MGCTLNSRECPLTVAVLAAIPCLFVGCVSNEYELDMTVEGETLHRRLVCSTAAGSEDPPHLRPMPEGELERIAAAYGVETPENAARKFVFSGDFTQRMPDDVGGFGTLAMYEAELGRSWVYAERFRGDDDLSATLAEREQSVDDVVDAATHWLGAELGDTPDFEAARELFDGPLRSDLHNVATYAFLSTAIAETGARDSSGTTFEMLVRLSQFGLERNYLTPSDLPELVQAANGRDGAALLPLVRRMIASKLGPDAGVDEWRFLDSPESVAASINQGLRDYRPYTAHLEQWRDAHEDDDPADAPKPVDWVGGLVLRALGINFSGGDALRVRLHCPARPFRTNGVWSGAGGVVSWDTGLNSRSADSNSSRGVLPAMLFACWSVPDEAVQTEHFGRVILRDEPLAQYVMWRETLPEQESGEWDRFITRLQPSTILRGRIEAFRFQSDPPVDGEGRALSQRGRELILSGLDGEE